MESGKLIVDVPADQRGKAMNLIRGMKKCVYVLEIKVFQKKRSTNANRYYWEMAGKIAKERRISPVDVYREHIPDVGDNFTTSTVSEKDADRFLKAWSREGLGWISEIMGPSNEPGKVDIICYYGSSFFSVSQMARLIDLAVQDCRNMGIETKTQEELDSLLGAWQ